MKLDKRIFPAKRPLTCFDAEYAKQFIGKKGFVAAELDQFCDLNQTDETTLKNVYQNKIGCFVTSLTRYRYFLPSEWVKEPEKKYIPFSLAEWTDRFAIGDTIIMRQSNCTSSGQPYTTYHYMYEGFCYDSDETWGDPNTGYIRLGGIKWAFDELLNEYEFLWHGTWQPFGMVKEK